MENKYYSVNKVAELINMHPKTIRRYIREGKLAANKIGKEWRISGHDLSIFTEGDSYKSSTVHKAIDGSKSFKKTAAVSSVIDIDVNDMDEAIRIVNMLTATQISKPPEYGRSNMNAQFLESEFKVRVMLWGSIEFMENILSSIKMLIKQES